MEQLKDNLLKKNRLNIRFCGQGGQGAILMAYLFGKAAILDGFNAVQTQKYGPESRGTPVNSDLVLSKEENVKFPLFKYINLLVSLSSESYYQNIPNMAPGGIIILDNSTIRDFHANPNVVTIPATQLAMEHFNSKIFTNIIMLGFVNQTLRENIRPETFVRSIKESINHDFIKNNIEAFKLGFSYCEKKDS